MMLIPGAEEKFYRLPKNGSIRNIDIIRILQKRRFSFPVGYLFEWDEDYKTWVGKTKKVGRDTVEK